MYYVVKNNVIRGKFSPMFMVEAFLWSLELQGEVVEQREGYDIGPEPLLKNKCRVLPGEISPGQYARLTSHLQSSQDFLDGESLGRRDKRAGTYSVYPVSDTFLKGYYYGYHGKG